MGTQEMTQSQKEIYQEAIQQGMRKQGAIYLAQRFDTKEQEQTMMKYLVSIREEHVNELEVILVARKISKTI